MEGCGGGGKDQWRVVEVGFLELGGNAGLLFGGSELWRVVVKQCVLFFLSVFYSLSVM